MTEKLPDYPLIYIHCWNMGSLSYYVADELQRARSVKAPRDTYAAGHVSGEVQIHRWSDIPPSPSGEGSRERMARQCRERYGIDPSQL